MKQNSRKRCAKTLYIKDGEVKSVDWWRNQWNPGMIYSTAQCNRRRGHEGTCHADAWSMRLIAFPPRVVGDVRAIV